MLYLIQDKLDSIALLHAIGGLNLGELDPMETSAIASLQLPLTLPMAAIAQLCQRWQITEFALFGSILRDTFRPDSDIDILVTFAEDADWSLFDLVTIEDELKALLQRDVDLVMKRSIEQSHNWIRRQEILSTARVIYAA